MWGHRRRPAEGASQGSSTHSGPHGAVPAWGTHDRILAYGNVLAVLSPSMQKTLLMIIIVICYF